MASAGKKGKKNKGTVISLQSFLSNADTPAGTTQVSKKLRNLDGDDSDDGSSTLPSVYQLPTAPRANRIFDDNFIPHRAPFIAYINNLPFDANEDDLYEFFGSIHLISLRLPREDGENGRSRGFGYVELETRDDLIHVLSLPDPSIKGRRIRIELSNENDQQNRQKNRRFDGFGNSGENRDSGNWRRDSQNNSGNFSSYTGNFDRGYNRDRKAMPEREESNTPGSWRTNTRPQSIDSSPTRRDDQSDKYRVGRERNTERYERREEPSNLEERPKLNLKPRTLPLPDIKQTDVEDEDIEEKVLPKQSGVPSVNVFGAAKPVDTAARELEIEERLAVARKQDKIRQEDDLCEKLEEVQMDKNDNESVNAAPSWRRNPDKSEDIKDEERRDEGTHSRLNQPRDRIERPEHEQGKASTNGESKIQEDNKHKRDSRNDRSLPKYTPNTGPVLQSSNKYSGLDDEEGSE